MSETKSKASRTCNKCIKGTSSFLKAQIALLRASGRSQEASLVINKLKACIKLLNGASQFGPDASCVTISVAANDLLGKEPKHGDAPVKAVKPGAYVRNFFQWLSAKGVSLPAETIGNGLDLKWSVKNLDLWRPLFATSASLTKADREGHRFWGKPFEFAGISLYVNSQWYGKTRGRKQKTGFDRFAVELAKACGLSFSPYALPGLPYPSSEHEDASCSKEDLVCKPAPEGITIRISSMKKRTFRFKG